MQPALARQACLHTDCPEYRFIGQSFFVKQLCTMLLLRALILALPAAAALVTSDSSCRQAAVPADCSRRDLRRCGRPIASRCQSASPSMPRPRWCRCCIDCDTARLGADAGATVGDKTSSRRQLRRRLRRLVRRLGANRDAADGRRLPAARRDRMMEQLLDLELRLLSLRKRRRKSAKRGRKKNTRNAAAAETAVSAGKSKIGGGRGAWSPGSLEQQYFVDRPASQTGAANSAENGTEASSGRILALMSYLEGQRTDKVKATCRSVTCSWDKGQLCLVNIQDLPICSCVTNDRCLAERRRLRQRRRNGRRRSGRRRGRRRPRRNGLDGRSNVTTTESTPLIKRQFFGRVCALLSGLPAERSYTSLCHMQAAACASDSQVLRLSNGACSNHDPESEALETLTNQTCARCQARGWRGRGCKKWRRKCRRPPVLSSDEF
ncbi:hypothetical protein BOX15_Mlig029094g4 [Macrostomum lignano]|uniref:Uncharacterized protein n=3 Tax=Macrostomum lignano TaxID=282301 RepID=A0A267DCG4_9PLAT|nr:hypothetical protein BOX15_Mlig029094g4 [Macrostomum lignano]